MKESTISTPKDASLQPRWCVLATTSQHSGQTPLTSQRDADNAKSFADIPCTPPNNLHSLRSPWLFAIWGMNILGPLPKAPRAVKYLLVVIDYFTKWIEAKPLWEIMANAVEKFTWKHLICKYNLPYAIVTNNTT